jgi:excisionase family DNA binding protein
MTAEPKPIAERDIKPANDELADDVLDVPGVMKLLGMGRRAVYEGCARGVIPHRRIGKLLRFSRSALLAWLASAPHSREPSAGVVSRSR